MSDAATALATKASLSTGLDAGLIRRQITGILRLELRRQLLAGRAFLLYFLAFTPLLILLVWAMSPFPKSLGDPSATQTMFAWMFEWGVVRVMIFLGTLLIFGSLFRSEILEKSLHYYFLTPVRREVLVLGKYLAALATTGAIFTISTLGFYLVLRSPWGFGSLTSHLFNGPGLWHLFSYSSIAFLACAGYGAIFMLVGLFLRNPVVPGVIIWGWEFLNPFLPALLKKFSVIHYLHGLYPIPLVQNTGVASFLEILVEPTPAWIAVPGLILFIALILTAVSWRVRGMEVHYGGD